ncbi:hypothetical protein B0T19DRAFT_112025 [Cercophora scortea]|uniref:Uncharacterized protein n=1 Tax=Cercophora scortea TaxID=314031 RepID=A0AAE0MHH8_9PEZI|nr:hypothetical protein B0T19DRAFT_112025 [Cercophora scortea]
MGQVLLISTTPVNLPRGTRIMEYGVPNLAQVPMRRHHHHPTTRLPLTTAARRRGQFVERSQTLAQQRLKQDPSGSPAHAGFVTVANPAKFGQSFPSSSHVCPWCCVALRVPISFLFLARLAALVQPFASLGNVPVLFGLVSRRRAPRLFYVKQRRR